MHNQHIVDVKEMGNGSFSSLSNVRNPFFCITSIKTNTGELILTTAGLGPAVGLLHQSVSAPMTKRRDPSPRQRADRATADRPAYTRYSTNATRSHHSLCYRCGKKHGPVCKLTIHPDANTNPDVKWSDTITGRAMALANAGSSVDLKNRWSHSEKRLVPLEASVADAIRTAIQAGRSTGRSHIFHATTTSTHSLTTPNVEGGPP